MADPATFDERFTGDTPESTPTFESEAQKAAQSIKSGNYLTALSEGASAMVAGIPEGIASLFTMAKQAREKGLTPSQEVEFGVNGFLVEMGRDFPQFKMPPRTATAFDNFHEQVVKPVATNMASPPSQPEPVRSAITIPLDPRNVTRSRLAFTGEPHVDAVLNSPVTRDVIDNAVIDRSHDVPYTAGGSNPLNDRTTFIDRHFPRAFNVDGVTFDPAEPFAIHENVEQHTMEILKKGGMDDATAYKVAHFEFAEKAEGAWYQAHGIDQAKAEAAYKPYLGAIQKGIPQEVAAVEASGDKILYQGVRHQSVGGPAPNAPQRSEYWTTNLDKAKTYAGPDGFVRAARWSDFPQEAKDRGIDFKGDTSTFQIGTNGPGKVLQVPEIARFDRDQNFPPNLYKDPYPHDSPFAARDEALGEPRPTPEEIDRAKGIIAKWQADGMPGPEPAPLPKVNPLQEAHELGVVGWDRPENIDLAELARREKETPAESAFRAVPLNAAVTPENMRGVMGHAPGEYDARGKEWIEKIDDTDAAKASIEALARQYDFFPESRGGMPSAASRAAVAEAAGIDPRDMDANHFSATFDSDGKVRAVVQALRQTTADFVAASEKLRREPNDINAAAALEAQERQRHVLEYTLGARAESGRSLAAWKDLLKETERSRALPKIKADEAAGKLPSGVADVVDAARDVQKNLQNPKEPLGLDKLIKNASDLVEAQDRAPKTRQGLTDVAKRARSAAKEAEAGKTPSGLAGLIGEAEELAKTLPTPPKEIGKPQPQGIASMIGEARRAVGGPSGSQALIKLAEEAERLAMTMPRTPAEAAAKLPADVASLVNQARSVINNFGKPGDSNLEKLVGRVDQQTRDILKAKPATKPKEALPPEWQALVDKADFVTKRFGGIAKAEAAAMLLARAGRTAAEQAELARQVEGLTPNQIARVLERLRTEKRPGWLFWFVQQGLISGLITHTKYAFVNTAQTVFERIIAPETAAVIGRLRGQDTSLLAPLRSIPEFFNAVPDALRGAKQAFKTNARVPLESELRLAERGEKNPEAAGAQVPYGSPQGPDWGRVGRWFPQGTQRAQSIFGVPGRSANSIHTVFKILNERMAAGSRAFEKAEKEGNAPGTEKFWDSYHYHLDNPTDDVLRANVEDGYSGTFMQKLGKQSEAFARLVKNTPAKWLLFFTHIPMNMARSAVEYSPLAFLNTLGETKMGAAIKGELGADAQNLAFAKIAIGTAVGGYFISRALSGEMTGDYPTNQKERKRWQLEGIQPNSIEADGQWISLERLGPQATVARIAANFADVIKNYDGSDNDAFMKATWATVLGTARALASDVGFESIRNIVDIMENPQEAARAAAYQLASYTMPLSLAAQFASFHDPYMRVANDYVSALKYRLPLLRETLPAKRDPLYGEPVTNPGHLAIFRSAPAQVDRVKMELNRLGYFPSAPGKTIGGAKLTPEQYDKYAATAGPLVKAALSGLVQSPQWQGHRNNPEWQKAVAKSIIAQARRKAAGALQMDDHSTIGAGRQRRLLQINGR